MEKRVVIGTSLVLLAIAAVGFMIYLVFYHEFDTPIKENENEVTALTPYGQALSGLGTYAQWNATWEKILNSDTAYLYDPSFDVTADNFQQCLYDFLAAPARLYFYIYEGASLTYYKCDSPEIRTAFADVFQGLSLTECSEEEYNDKAGSEYNTQIFIFHIGGTVNINCYHDYSCIWIYRRHMNTDSSTGDYFYVEENLHDKAVAAYEKLLPYSMEAPRWEIE